jgi:hypothetical protein
MRQIRLSMVEEGISGNRGSRIVGLSQTELHRGSDRIAYRSTEQRDKNREGSAIVQSPNQLLLQGRNNERILDSPGVSEGLGRRDAILLSASPPDFRFCAAKFLRDCDRGELSFSSSSHWMARVVTMNIRPFKQLCWFRSKIPKWLWMTRVLRLRSTLEGYSFINLIVFLYVKAR